MNSLKKTLYIFFTINCLKRKGNYTATPPPTKKKKTAVTNCAAIWNQIKTRNAIVIN